MKLVKNSHVEQLQYELHRILKQLLRTDVNEICKVKLDEARWDLNTLCWRTQLTTEATQDVIAAGHTVQYLYDTPTERLRGLSVMYEGREITMPEAMMIMAEALTTKAVALQNAEAA